MYPWLQISPKTFLVESLVPGVSSQLYEITSEGEIIKSWDSHNFFLCGLDYGNNVFGTFKRELPSFIHQLELVSFSSKTQLKILPLNRISSPLKCDDWTCRIYYRKSDHSFWYRSESRFFVFHPEQGMLFDFNREFPEIAKNVIQDIYFHKSGKTVVSTSHGFYIIKLSKNPFQRYLYNAAPTYDLNRFISCRGMVRKGNTLWVSTEEQGDYKVDLSNMQPERLPEFKVLDHQNRLADIDHRLAFLADDDHLLFANVPINHYQISDKTYQTIYWEEEYSSGIWSLYKDLHETIWVGTWDGPLGFINPSLDSIHVFKQWNDFELPSGGVIYTFLELDKENMLIGTSFGIYLLNHQKGIIERYWTGGSEANYFPNDNIFHLTKDLEEEGRIWVATGGGGLIRWQYTVGSEQASNSIRQFTIADGLSNNTIYAVYEDEVGNLWLPSDYGVIQFNKHTHFTKAYLEKDGITYNEFNRISHHQDEKGNLYFGGLNGITAFHPKDFTVARDTLNVPLRITEFQQYNSETNLIEDRTFEILKNPQIRLQPGERFFNIKFALLEYQNASRIRYAYKIDGQDKNWNLFSNNSLRISGLTYGHYTLRIKGQGANGQFSKQELSIPIYVLKPFYLKAWFLALSIFGICALAFSWYKNRTTQLKKQQRLLEKMVLERTETIEKQKEELQHLDKIKSRFFANVSHELRTPLTLILGPLSSMIKGNRLTNRDFTFAKLIQTNTQNLLSLVNEILDLTKMESSKIKLKEEAVPFYPFLQRLIAAFESHAQYQQIELKFQYQADKYLQLELDSTKFEKIFNNLLSNALKFTAPKGSIMVHIEDLANRILLTVQDTGRGIHPDDLPNVFSRFYQSSQPNAPTEGGTGIGLALSLEFSKLMNGSLRVESILGKGSTFFFEFPKKQIMGTSTLLSPSKEHPSAQETGISKKYFNLEATPSSFPQQQSLASIPTNTQATTDNRQPTLLIVEDNHALRDYIQLILSEKYQIITMENGELAWAFLNDGLKTPHLILSDIMMPQMDGYQLLQKLKSDDRYRHLPVIMLTARAERKDRLKALRIGVDDYILKPFDEEELFTRVENLLQNHKERQLAFSENQFTKNETPNPKNIQQHKLSSEDLQWLQDLEFIVKEELSNFDFNVESLSTKMAMSKRQIGRKVKQLVGMTPSKYIQEVRLNQARQMLENRSESSVKAVAYSIGVKDVVHFSRLFKDRFGKLPSKYL